MAPQTSAAVTAKKTKTSRKELRAQIAALMCDKQELQGVSHAVSVPRYD
jgi:hypothetical protein